MNYPSRAEERSGFVDPFAEPLDALLIEIAIRLQLPPGLHAKAVQRYEAVRRYIERSGSPLANRVACFYPQGSMGIDATISTRGTDDEYDLDIIAELDVGEDVGPEQLLDLLEEALAGYPVDIVRQTRCITLNYSDSMHLDVTPARRLPNWPEKESEIAHAKKGATNDPARYVAMNAWGFLAWYRARTPTEERFALAVNKRLYEEAGLMFKAAADVHDVPEQTPLVIKSVTTVALQLLKRHRNIVYQDATGRIPPSVLLSCHAGHAAKSGLPLTEMVIRQARWTAKALDDASRARRLLDVRNPAYASERFTDRWPETADQQAGYSHKLHALADGLEMARDQGAQLEDLQDWLREQFGERVVTRSVVEFNEHLGSTLKAGRQRYTGAARLFIPSAPALVAATTLSPVAARAHTNMGERR